MSANRALIVYETMFGNTERIAWAIRDGLRQYVPAEAIPVNRASDVVPGDVGLLVVGGPTHAFSMSRLSTRQDAWKQGDVVMPIEVGIRDWLAALEPPRGRQAPRVTTFDTRIAKVRRLPGSAARSADDRDVGELLRERHDRTDPRRRARACAALGRGARPAADRFEAGRLRGVNHR
ncbi:MAG TPA: flavodoxin family protein [Kribbella sp.]